MENNRQEPPKQEPNRDTKTEGANGHPKSVTRRDGSGLRAVIKALDGVGALGLFGAGVLTFTTHKPFAVICLFIALSAFASAVFLTKYPSLKRSQRVKRQKAVRVFLTAELLFIAACGVLFWIAMSKTRQQPTNAARVPIPTLAPSLPMVSQSSISPSPTTNRRELLDIDPEKLPAFFEKYNEAQVDDLLKPYIGKWMEIPDVSQRLETIFS